MNICDTSCDDRRQSRFIAELQSQRENSVREYTMSVFGQPVGLSVARSVMRLLSSLHHLCDPVNDYSDSLSQDNEMGRCNTTCIVFTLSLVSSMISSFAYLINFCPHKCISRKEKKSPLLKIFTRVKTHIFGRYI